MFWEMGVGKSKLVVDTASMLFLNCEIDGLLIVAPKGGYLTWIYEELPKHLPDNIPHRVAYWKSYMNKRENEALDKILRPVDDVLDIFVMNVEAFVGIRAFEIANLFLRMHYGMMVIDESSTIKSIKAARTKACIQLGRLADYRRVLSGTPITHSPLDIYSQCEFLEKGCLGHTSWTGFKQSYALEKRTIMYVNGRQVQFNQIVGYKNLDTLSSIIAPLSSRITKDECLDIPSKIYSVRIVEHTDEQEKLYRQIRDEAVAIMEGGMITTTHVLKTMSLLHMINCGHVKNDEGVSIELPSNRVLVLLEILNECQGKVLIWCAFQRDVEIVERALPAGSFVTYYGPTLVKDRADAIARFKTDDTCKYFVATQATGGRALNLAVATTEVFYSNSYSLEQRLQSEDRAHRIGQKHHVNIVDLVTPKTVDEKILKSHKEKKNLADTVLDNWRYLLGV